MTPTTLPALRTAVARVLVARGESAEALACDARRAARGYPRGAPWYARIAAPWESLGAPAAWASDTWGATEADAIALAWGRFVADAAARVVDCEGARDAAEARLRRARAACEAAGVGGGDYRDV